jgi:hypothetical protein
MNIYNFIQCSILPRRVEGTYKEYLIQPTIYLEMPEPSQGHYGFHSFPVVD